MKTKFFVLNTDFNRAHHVDLVGHYIDEVIPYAQLKAVTEIDGIYFNTETTVDVVSVLLKSYHNKLRLNVFYGDAKTGKLWGDREQGHVGRSTGSIKIPLLIKTKRSMGGGALLDDCVVKITTAVGRRHLYVHPNLHN